MKAKTAGNLVIQPTCRNTTEHAGAQAEYVERETVKTASFYSGKDILKLPLFSAMKARLFTQK